MNKQYKDTDIREALRRKYSETPQLPADFMAKMEQRMDSKPTARTRRLWPWLAAAASVLIIIGIGFLMQPNHGEPQAPLLAKTSVEPKQEQPTTHEVNTQESEQAEKKQEQTTQKSTAMPVSRQQAKSKQATTQKADTDEEGDETEDGILHYASQKTNEETVPYQDPARVDSFISKLAIAYKVKEGELKCSKPIDSNITSMVYVFPDKEEINVFGRLLQVACWYKSETPGYRLNFSNQQFFFELKDMRQQLKYRWIAERINGKILLYGTHAPLDTPMMSSCFQEYRDELMHINSINKKPKKI